jgi:lysophospholipase L1-like esterase
MKIFRQTILAVAVGLLAVLILLEAALRITGAFYMKDRLGHKQYEKQTTQDAYTILCLGNSWTMGSGAEPGESYPDHLRRMLENTFHDKDIRVINAGVGNLNSTEMLDRLKPQLNSIRPDLVILRTGEPNASNNYKYSNYLKRKNRIRTKYYDIVFTLNDYLYEKIRTYRFMQLLFYETTEKIKLILQSRESQKGFIETFPPGLDKTENISYKTQRHDFQTEYGYIKAAEMGMLWGEIIHKVLGEYDISISASDSDIEQAIGWLERASHYHPNFSGHYLALANLYILRKDHKRAAESLMKGIIVNPIFRDEDYQANACYFLLHSLYGVTPDIETKETIERFIDKAKKHNPDIADIFLWSGNLSHKNISEWIASDIDEIVRIIKYNNIDLIIHSYPPPFGYPMWENDPMVLASEILRSKAIELGVPFVDHERLFSEMYAQGCNQEDYHEKIAGKTIQGGHFNEKGYETMAGFVYDKIIEEGFIK